MGSTFILIFILLIIALLITWFIITYKKIEKAKNNRLEKFAKLDILLKHRIDLIPKLILCIEDIMKDKKLVTTIVELRSKIAETTEEEKIVSSNIELGKHLAKLLVKVEKNQTLNTDDNFLKIINDIIVLESKIQVARIFYNDMVKEYNDLISSFPTKIIASIIGQKEYPFFEITKEEKNISTLDL